MCPLCEGTMQMYLIRGSNKGEKSEKVVVLGVL